MGTEYILKSDIIKVLELSRKMLNAAKSGDWDYLSGLEEQRRLLLSEFFSESTSSEDLIGKHELLLEIQKINNEIIISGETVMDNLSEQLCSNRKKFRLQDAYSTES